MFGAIDSQRSYRVLWLRQGYANSVRDDRGGGGSTALTFPPLAPPLHYTVTIHRSGWHSCGWCSRPSVLFLLVASRRDTRRRVIGSEGPLACMPGGSPFRPISAGACTPSQRLTEAPWGDSHADMRPMRQQPSTMQQLPSRSRSGTALDLIRKSNHLLPYCMGWAHAGHEYSTGIHICGLCLCTELL